MTDIPGTRAGSRLRFTATALPFFLRYLAAIIGSIFIIPAPWLAAWFISWFLDHVEVEDGTELTFVGKGGDIWLPIMLTMLIGFSGNFFGELGFVSPATAVAFPLLLLPVNALLLLFIVRWYVGSSRLDGNALRFAGTFWSLLGYYLLYFASVFTIIGWAWVSAAAIRWYYRNIEGDYIFTFTGKGYEILWRTLVFILASILIIPIPWVLIWLSKWFITETTIERAASTIEAEAGDEAQI